jgi:hypothetical protein
VEVDDITQAVAAASWFESLAVAQFTRRGGRPLQRRVAETDFSFWTAVDLP